ncbi:hypothetical protein L1S35_05375 [Flavobacterium sp. AS60]|uniref:hypothetical protein n=1 Tax=Flavobacterium anseongense TaxID=2910677 RepID=UPI001F2B2858|nr:hypothetical protein [Flavobacterium sp. AS60]MCF6129096.1 hypothetical protein [Flavobacterium sp. AS60]
MEIILSIIGGFLIGYFTSYFNEKGKNKAAIEDTQQLTEEREKVTSKYNLDSTRRKIQYETKSSAYMKYFNLLDEQSQIGNIEAQEEFLPIIAKFNTDYLSNIGNTKKEASAAAEFSNSTQKLMLKSQERYHKFKNETNALKLIAGESVLYYLNEMDRVSQLSFDVSAQMMKDMGKNIIAKDLSALNTQKDYLEDLAKQTNELKEKLVNEIRQELSEI